MLWALVLAISVAGGLVRFVGIEKQGPWLYDDGYYSLEARWLYDFVETVGDSVHLMREERRTGVDLWNRYEQFDRFEAALKRHPVLVLQPPIRPLYVARPLHIAMIVIVMLLFGPVPWAAAAAAATMSTLTVPALFWAGRRLLGNLGALAASGALALSSFDLLYARKGYAESGSLFFLVLAFGCYLRSREDRPDESFDSERLWWMLGAGAAWGLAVAVHDRWLLMAVIPGLMELHAWITRRGWGFGAILRRGLTFLLGLALPLIAIEFAHYVALVLCNIMGFVYPVPTYFEQLASHIPLAFAGQEAGKIEGAGPMNALTYPYLYGRLEGPLYCVLALVGLGALVRRREPGGYTVALWFLFPCLFYGFTRAAARYGSIAIPAAAILVGAGFVACVAWAARRRSGEAPASPGREAAVLAVLCALVSGWFARDLIRSSTSGYAEAAAFAREHDEGRMVSTGTYNTMTYLGYEGSVLPPTSWEELEALYRKGYRYVLVDFYKYYLTDILEESVRRGMADPENRARLEASGFYEKFMGRMEDWRRRVRTLSRVEAEAPLVLTIANPFGVSAGDIFEINTSFAATLAYLRHPPEGADKIRIYDLAPLFGPAAPAAPEGAPS